jgi:hypothetical protein
MCTVSLFMLYPDQVVLQTTFRNDCRNRRSMPQLCNISAGSAVSEYLFV